MGRGGSVHAVADVYKFTDLPLEDCGDGWDWRAPEGLRYWLPEGLSFEVRDGDWDGIGALEVHYRSGRAAFGRCLSGLDVRASGSCYPTSLLAEGEEWELRVSTVDGATQTGEVIQAVAETSVTIKGVQLDQAVESVLAWLPFAEGVFVGSGSLMRTGDGVQISFNEEGVQYVAR